MHTGMIVSALPLLDPPPPPRLAALRSRRTTHSVRFVPWAGGEIAPRFFFNISQHEFRRV